MGVLGMLGVLWNGFHLTWLYNANWTVSTVIIHKWQEIPTFLQESNMAAKYIV